MKPLKLALLITVAIFTISTISFADIPHTINYQGKLTGSSGSPVSDGTYSVTFRIYDQQAGGSPIWYETQSITTQKGLLDTQIGATKDLDLSFDEPYYLGIKVGTDAEMVPRQSLSSSAYAFRAKTAEVAKAADSLTQAVNFPGEVVQVVNFQTGQVATGTNTIPFDDTIPQITEGNKYMSLSIIPKDPSNKLLVDVTWIGSSTQVNANFIVALFKRGQSDSLAATVQYLSRTSNIYTIRFQHLLTANTASEINFQVKAGGQLGEVTFNGINGQRKLGGVSASSITITEIKS